MNRATVILVPLIGLCGQAATQAASTAPVAAENGMVVSAQHLATRVGVDILKRGGTAIDASIAIGYALAVTFPAAGNLGGGGFMTIQLADGRKTFIDFRETAPLAATADMYLDAQGNVIPDRSIRGHLAVGVPGTVSGLEYVREKYGTLPRAALIAPSIALAEQGFVLDQGDVDLLNEATEDFRKDAPSAAIFLKRGARYVAGERLVQSDLARTLRAVSRSAWRVSTRAPWRQRSSRRARAAEASSRKRISMRTKRASCRRSSVTIAIFTSCQRRRRARAAARCARCC